MAGPVAEVFSNPDPPSSSPLSLHLYYCSTSTSPLCLVADVADTATTCHCRWSGSAACSRSANAIVGGSLALPNDSIPATSTSNTSVKPPASSTRSVGAAMGVSIAGIDDGGNGGPPFPPVPHPPAVAVALFVTTTRDMHRGGGVAF